MSKYEIVDLDDNYYSSDSSSDSDDSGQVEDKRLLYNITKGVETYLEKTSVSVDEIVKYLIAECKKVDTITVNDIYEELKKYQPFVKVDIYDDYAKVLVKLKTEKYKPVRLPLPWESKMSKRRK
jgi:hypothetical protein